MDRKIVKILISLVITALGAHAQEKEIELDPVTITASMRPVISSHTGRNISVIHGEQFANLPVYSIDDLLRYMPGIEIQQRGPMGSQSDIVLRGATFQQVLVILDGVRINDPNTGHFTSYIPIAPAEIDRIEVLKGASSAIYGSEAVGGVINILTRSFAGRQTQPSHHYSAQAAIGEYGLISGNLGGFWQNKNIAIGGGLLANNSKGQPQRGQDGFFNNHTASLSLTKLMNPSWTVSLRSAFDNRKFSAQNFYTSFVSDTAEEQVKTFWNQFRLLYQKANNKLSFDAAYRNTNDQYTYNPAATPNENTSSLFQTNVVFDHLFRPGLSLVTGVQFQNKSIRSNDRGNHNVKQAACFVILTKTVGENLVIVPALRADYHENAGTELVPQLNLSWHTGRLQLRGSAGKTIRQADFTEGYNNYNKTFVGGGSIGNPKLEAERSFSYEAGADYVFHPVLKLSGTVFRREQKNVVDWIHTPYNDMPRKDNLSPTGDYALATNIAKVNTTGIETELRYAKHISRNQSLATTLGLIWLNTNISGTVKSFYILSHAKFLANLSLNYQWKDLAFGTTAIFKKQNPTAPNAVNIKIDNHCFMLNVKLDYTLVKNSVSCFVEADNLLNEHCRDLVNALRPARWLMGGVKLNINQ